MRVLKLFVLPVLLVLFSAVRSEAQTITQQPANVSVPAGQTAVFTISVSGGPCESVWYSSSPLIGNHYGPGDSASPISYEIPNTTTAMNGATVQAIIFDCAGGSAEPLSSTATLSVTPSAPLASITVTPSAPTIAVGAMQAFTATGHYSDGSTSNLTTSATWASDTPTVASVIPGGVVTAVAVGTANISATLAGVTASAPVTVDLSSVTLTLNTTNNTSGKANSALLFDNGAAILPGPIAISQAAGSTTLPAGTITSDANGNLSGSLTINANPQYLDANGNVVLTFGLSVIPNAITYPVPASEFSHGATGLTLNLILYKNNLDIKSQTIGFTP